MAGRQAAVWATQNDQLRLVRTVWLAAEQDAADDLAALSGELRRTLLSLSQMANAPSSTLPCIYCGENAAAIARQLASSLGRPVRGVGLEELVEAPVADLSDLAPMAALAAAVAADRPSPVDLLHPHRRPAPPSRRRTYTLAGAAAGCVALALAWTAYRNVHAPLEASAANDAERTRLEPTVTRLAAFEQQATAVDKWLAEAPNLLTELDYLSQHLRPKPIEDTSFNSGEDMLLTKLSLAGRQLTLDGAARTTDALAAIERRLRDAKYRVSRGVLEAKSETTPGYEARVSEILERDPTVPTAPATGAAASTAATPETTESTSAATTTPATTGDASDSSKSGEASAQAAGDTPAAEGAESRLIARCHGGRQVTRREKNLAIAVAGAGVLWGLMRGVESYRTAVDANEYTAMRAANARDDAEFAVQRGERAKRRLIDWGKRSLPADPDLAKSLYQDWVRSQLAAAGLSELQVTDKTLTRRNAQFRELSIEAKAAGTVEQLVDFLYKFYTAPHLHRISAASITPSDNGAKLALVLTIDALALPDTTQIKELAKEGEQKLPRPVEEFKTSLAGRNVFKPQTPGAGDSGAAASAVVTAIMSDGAGGWHLWIHTDEPAKTHKYQKGDRVEFGKFNGKIVELDARHVVIETAEGKVQVMLGQNLGEAKKVEG